jgi:hypothetical protein
LIERFAENLEVARMVAIRLENLSDVLTLKGRPELRSFEELVSQLSGRRTELVTLLPVAPAAQVRRVVGREP